jgi:hypothetical protein
MRFGAVSLREQIRINLVLPVRIHQPRRQVGQFVEHGAQSTLDKFLGFVLVRFWNEPAMNQLTCQGGGFTHHALPESAQQKTGLQSHHAPRNQRALLFGQENLRSFRFCSLGTVPGRQVFVVQRGKLLFRNRGAIPRQPGLRSFYPLRWWPVHISENQLNVNDLKP